MKEGAIAGKLTPTANEARAEIAKLVGKFAKERNLAQSEADVRAGYIDLLFHALGWNVYNEPGQITNYRREGYVRGAGYVDVGLELRGQPVLFLEAKRFGRIPTALERAGDRTTEEKQAFRYARGKKITYAVLTNFERLHIFNADHERLIYAFDHPQEYLKNFEALWRLSPSEVERGSLPWWEGQLEKGDVDLQFLAALRRWRLELANGIYEHNASNPHLNQSDGSFDFDQLMAAVQRILDRLILIRYGDDKEVLLAHDLLDTMLADYRNRGAYASPDHLMRAFVDLSHMMDKHHNTTLFAPGHVCEQVTVPNETLAKVIEETISISFRKFASDILGNTYESYLGTRLTLRNGQIEDEERRDVRKGKGIYYTPRWVVEYIVDSTLGRRLKELEEEHGLHAIEKVRGLAILDPACGSGSFLIYAYQVLANFYRRLNESIAQEQARLLANAAQFKLFETLEEIRHLPQPVVDYPDVILQEHLFGMDLDPEAAEIAAVNLTMQAFADSHEKKLPLILNENIKVGNSLISGGEEDLKRYFGEAWPEKHPFNWADEFPEVMGRGGFDLVVGNPPYVGFHGFDEEKSYYRDAFDCASGRFDVYMLFVEQSLRVLKPSGLLGFICPTNFMKRQHGEALRNALKRASTIIEIVDFKHRKVFADALNYTCIMILQKGEPSPTHVITYRAESTEASPYGIGQNQLSRSGWVFLSPEASPLVDKIKSVKTVPLDSLVDGIEEGIVTGKNDVFVLSKDEASLIGLEPDVMRSAIQGKQIDRYRVGELPRVLIYPYENVHGKSIPLEESAFEARYPTAYHYLLSRKNELSDRSYFDRSRKAWYEIWNERSYSKQTCLKIVVRELATRGTFALGGETQFYLDTVCGIIPRDRREESLYYLLGLLNSALLDYYYKATTVPKANGFFIYKTHFLKQLPIRCVDFDNAGEREMHGQLVRLVERMLGLQKRKAELSPPQSELEDVERLIDDTDHEIDNLVYDLYDLTEEERQVVEEAGR